MREEPPDINGRLNKLLLAGLVALSLILIFRGECTENGTRQLSKINKKIEVEQIYENN